jgi:hypothetical protein
MVYIGHYTRTALCGLMMSSEEGEFLVENKRKILS